MNLQKFQAEGGYDIYEWYIGDEVEPRYGKELQLDFGGYLGNLNIKLIARDTIQKDCFEEIRVDTAYKRVTFIDYHDAKILGKYKGLNSDYDIEIIHAYGQTGTEEERDIRVLNFPDVCEELGSKHWPYTIMEVSITNSQIYFDTNNFLTPACPSPRGFGILKNDTLKIEYENYYTEEGYYEAVRVKL